MSFNTWAGLAGLLILAPLLPGIALKIRARLTGRTGAPLLQLYYDVPKLLRRGRAVSPTVSWLFPLAPAACLTATVAAACLVPVGGAAAPVHFPGDMIALAGLLALGRYCLALGSLDTGSSFEGMGVSRELAVSMFAEPALFLVFVILAVATRQASLSGMLGAPLAASWSAAPAALVMAAIVLLVVLIGETGRGPVDDPTTHLELTMIHEVMILEYGGPDLALILLAGALRLGLMAALLAGIVLPWIPVPPGLAPAACGLLTLAIAAAVGLIETLLARLRLDRVPLFLISASIAGLLGCLLLFR